MARSISTIALLIVSILLFFSTSFAEMPLELIRVFQSDSAGAVLIEGCMSPGDMDGDGFSELFAIEMAGNKNLLVFKGGNPPDALYDMILGQVGIAQWLPDINNDGLQDYAIKKPKVGNLETVEIWFGSSDFLSKSSPDLIFNHIGDTVSGFHHGWYAGDLNGDNQNDLVIGAVNMELPPFDGRFYIYYGGDLLDTICDKIINFYRHDNGYNGFYRGSGLGDINGDGFLDLGYTLFKEGYDTSYFAIILGKIPLDSTPDIIIGTPFLWHDKPEDFGEVIEPLGDINKDGYDDFALGSSVLWPCIFYGGDPFDTIPKILGDFSNEITRGDRIANIGDINHDGWDDIGVGLISYDFESGLVNIFFGSRDMDTEVDLVLYYDEIEPRPGMDFGWSIGPAGDFNGDGIDDLVVSAYDHYMTHSNDRGYVYVFAGDSGLPTPAEDEPNVPLPEKYNILRQNYPNPFNNGTVIEYYLWGISDREIELSIYNILGQRIRILRKGIESGGNHFAYWDGKDDYGHDVCSGLYFYSLKTNNEVLSKKMIYLK